MKIWKLLIPLLVIANLAFGMPVLTANQTLEVEKRGDFSLVNSYIENFKDKALRENERAFFSKDKKLSFCDSQKGILKNNNLSKNQKLGLIKHYEEKLNKIDFFKISDGTELSWLTTGCSFQSLENYFKVLIDYKIVQIKLSIANLSFKNSGKFPLPTNNDLNNNEKNLVMNNIKKLSFELLKKVKKSL